MKCWNRVKTNDNTVDWIQNRTIWVIFFPFLISDFLERKKNYQGTLAVFPIRPSLDGRARPDGRLGKIARLTPLFLWFCPSICDFGHIHERYWAVWQTGQQRFQRALNHKKTTKSLKPEFCPSLRPSNARIFVQKVPVFRPYFYKNEPVWRIGNTGFAWMTEENFDDYNDGCKDNYE